MVFKFKDLVNLIRYLNIVVPKYFELKTLYLLGKHVMIKEFVLCNTMLYLIKSNLKVNITKFLVFSLEKEDCKMLNFNIIVKTLISSDYYVFLGLKYRKNSYMSCFCFFSRPSNFLV